MFLDSRIVCVATNNVYTKRIYWSVIKCGLPFVWVSSQNFFAFICESRSAIFVDRPHARFDRPYVATINPSGMLGMFKTIKILCAR